MKMIIIDTSIIEEYLTMPQKKQPHFSRGNFESRFAVIHRLRARFYELQANVVKYEEYHENA